VSQPSTLASVDWIERVVRVRRWTRNGERAAHKPLLLLYALGRFQAHGDAPIPFADAEPELALLLQEFGPPRKTSPGYPFHHLTSDGLWEVHTADGAGSPGPNVTALRNSGAVGQLTRDLAVALSIESHLLAQLARAILDANFEPSLHADIRAAAGLDVETDEISAAQVAPRQRSRSAEFRRDILTAYEYQCAFCGYDGMLTGVAVALEAAHVRWRAFDGPDTVENGICLCTLHHKLFDMGVLGMSASRTVTVSARFVGRSPAVRDQVLGLVDRPVCQPQPGFPLPNQAHLYWHGHQVFRKPARSLTASGARYD
jgi:putative restriction endonuclease